MKRKREGDPVHRKRTAVLILQLGAGVLVIAASIMVLSFLISEVQVRSAPAGFTIIRPPDEVSMILIDGDSVWTGGKGGVMLFDRISRSVQALPAGAPEFGYVRGIAKDTRGSVWIAHDGGLARFSRGTWTSFGEQSGAPLVKALSIGTAADGSVWIGTEGKVVKYRDGVWNEVVPPVPHPLASADVLWIDRQDNLWVGSGSPAYGGLFRFDGSQWTVYTRADGLPHPVVRDITGTRNGALWVATGFASQGGAAMYQNGSWTAFTTADGLAGPSTRSVYEDRSGRMWIGSEYDGVLVRNASVQKILTKKDGLAGNEVKVVREDQDGVFWIGTERGLSVISASAVPF